MKCAIILMVLQRFDAGTIYKLLGKPKFFLLAYEIYNRWNPSRISENCV